MVRRAGTRVPSHGRFSSVRRRNEQDAEIDAENLTAPGLRQDNEHKGDIRSHEIESLPLGAFCPMAPRVRLENRKRERGDDSAGGERGCESV